MTIKKLRYIGFTIIFSIHVCILIHTYLNKCIYFYNFLNKCIKQAHYVHQEEQTAKENRKPGYQFNITWDQSRFRLVFWQTHSYHNIAIIKKKRQHFLSLSLFPVSTSNCAEIIGLLLIITILIISPNIFLKSEYMNIDT